jgi:predicted dehydrogenase
VEIAAAYHPKKLDIAVENGAFINFKMKNGKTGSASVSFASPRGGAVGTLSNLGYEIYGSEAVCRAYGTMFQFSGYDDEPVKLRLEIDKGKDQESIYLENPTNVYAEILREHAESILAKKAGNAKSGIHSMKLLLAVHKSAQNSGKIITI